MRDIGIINRGMVDIGMLYDDEFDAVSDGTTTTGISVDGLLSNWFFVGGVSAGTVLVSVVIGLLLAKAKIKKGFDVYEN